MTCKKLDQILDATLWLIAIALVIVSWFSAESLTAPDYEPVKSAYHEEYQYEKEDGERVTGYYDLAWEHKSVFKKPLPVIYDSSRNLAYNIKDEYIEQYRAMMPPSEYSGFWHRMFWGWFILFSVICCVIVIMWGPDVRDHILYSWFRKQPSPKFVDLTYFLYYDRKDSIAGKIRAMVPAAATKYISEHRTEMERKYSPEFYNIIMRWMTMIRATGSTSIPFCYSFVNNLVQQQTFIDTCLEYWESRRGIDSYADNNIAVLKANKKKDFVTIPKISCTDTIRNSVVNQLKSMFAEILGNPIFNFYITPDYMKSFYKNNLIIVETLLINEIDRTFTTKAARYENQTFPGIRIKFTVYYAENGQRVPLWSKYLDPVCDYSAPEDDFNANDLYGRMVINTIDTFVETMKKG